MKTNEELMLLNDKLIRSIVKKYEYYKDKEDLYQVGYIGLLKAYKNYKENKETKFSSYAYFYIEGEIKEYIRLSSTFKYGKDFLKLRKSYDQAKSLLSQKLKKEPTTKEISLFLEIPIEKIIEIENSYSKTESLDYVNEDISLYDFIGFNEISYKEENIDLKNAIENLKEPDKTIIKSRFEYGFTQSEVSKQLGISQVKVSRLEKNILTRFRSILK